MKEDLARRRSIPSLDGLRGIAVLMVIAAHLGYLELAVRVSKSHHLALLSKLFEFDAGDLGVSTFFVISGFLITTLLLRNQDSKGRISLKNFYARRFFRIFPPYYFYLLVIAILWLFHVIPMLRGSIVSAMLYVSNYYPYRLSHPESAGWLVAHSWSLSLEEQFYLVWPAALHWLGRKRSAWLGFALLVLSPFLRMLTLHFAPGTTLYSQIDRMFHTRIDTIMAGCVLALIGVWPKTQKLLASAVRNKATGVVALVLLYLILHASWQSFWVLQWFGIGSEAVVLAFLLSYAIANADTWGGRLLNHAWLRHIGVISYSLYLWQQLWAGQVQVVGQLHFWSRGILILACAEISYFAIEKPSFRLRDWYLARGQRRPIAQTS